MILRPYQNEAVSAVFASLQTRDDNPCVVIPTGGGKTPIMATICKQVAGTWGGRICVLAHVKELLEQAFEKLKAICPEIKTGLYSAGLGKREKDKQIIVAGIQSVYQRACELDKFDLVLVDEAHLIPAGGDGMYRQFLTDARIVNPQVRVVGFTATPYRLDSGLICGPGTILNNVCYEIGVKELIVGGYLSKLISKGSLTEVDLTNVTIRGGEYVSSELETAMDQDVLVSGAVDEILALTAHRNAVLIFASGIQHGKHVAETISERGHECAFICGETPAAQRAEILGRFRGESGIFDDSRLKYLVNVNVLTTGFDATNIDCIALLRPTLSPGLYYQMVGRGLRLHPGKTDCLVLDFGGNVLRHGPIDQIKIKEKCKGNGQGDAARQCPGCQTIIALGYAVCPECGLELPREKEKHGAEASTEAVLSGQITDTVRPVTATWYSVHKKAKSGEDHPKSLRVDYQVALNDFVSEWVCFEHAGYARKKAEKWWQERSNEPFPETAEDACSMARNECLAETREITVRHVSGERFDRIIGYVLGEKPEKKEYAGIEFEVSNF